MKRNLLLIIAFFAFWNVVTSQVNIGSNAEPENFSVLQLMGTDGGLRVNQLDETQVGALASSIIASGKLAEAQGLLVYNTTEGCYNMFKDESFQSLCASTSMATFDTDSALTCNSLVIYGDYMEGKSLLADNYLTLDVSCSQAGSYSFAGIVRNSLGSNGYAFTKSDMLLSTGRHTLVINGSGTPKNPEVDTLFITINQIQYSCPTGRIPVKPAPARAIFRIESAEQVGDHFTTSVDYDNATANAIKTTVKVTQGGYQTELTAVVNGVEFKYTPEAGSSWVGPTGYLDVTYKCDGTPIDSPENCSGTLTSDTTVVGDTTAISYEVILKCTGNPTTYGWHEVTVKGLSGKSGDMVYAPPVRLLFLSRAIRVLGAPVSIYNLAHVNDPHNLPYQMLMQPGNYIYKDEENPGQYIEGFTFTETGATLTEAMLNQSDIVSIGYNFHPGANVSLANFVKSKQGVLLFCGQDDVTNDVAMIKAITGATVTMNADGPGGSEYQFVEIADDPILNGHFGNCIGLYWGEDGGTNHRITSGASSRFVVYSYNNTVYPNCFRDNQLGFIWMGDGGVLASAPNSTDPNTYPFRIDSDKLPAAQPNYNKPSPVWNSLFIANSVWWAIDFLRKNGRID
ncbi:MAG: hypothetical protein LBR81_03015 [Prevotellaceae bacterium]|jgi:hypothetical protein|nr:hypothetical protein [Prevotellaceae bacterium]